MIILNTATLVVYGVLTVAIFSIWMTGAINKLSRIPIWIILMAISCLLGYYYGTIELEGIGYLIGLGIVCKLVKHHSRWIAIPSGFVVVGLVAGLFLHQIPFFNNSLVFSHYFLSDQSSEYTKYWNFDKAAAGLILLANFGDTCKSLTDWTAVLKKTYLISSITILITLTLALLFKYIQVDITFVSAYFAWAWANLLFTCISEEMLFRGFIQKYALYLTEVSKYQIAIVILIGILFGLTHFSGGAPYIILASVAGIGYGYSYYRSGKIESAIGTHFLLNSIHFLFFTYPSTRI